MDMKVLHDAVRGTLFKGKMTAKQVAGIERIIAAHDRYGTGLDTALAYHLETSYHETGRRMQPVRETFATSTKQAIDRLEAAWKAGKLKWVKTPYWREGYFGRGDAQLTHKANYTGKLRDAVLELFKVDIAKQPDKVLDPEISAFILVEGMTRGHTTKSDFTTYALEDFVNSHMTDYANARKVVNPGEKSSFEPMARDARLWEDAIRAARLAAGEEFRGAENERNLYDGRVYPEVRAVQEQLERLGYHEVGTIDGKWGSKTRTALLGFQADNNLPTKPLIDKDVLAALMMAEPREVSDARKNATVSELREEGAKDIKAADKSELAGYVGTGAGVLVTADKAGWLDKLGGYSDTLSSVGYAVQPFKDIITDNLWLILLGVGGVVIWQAWKMKKIRLEKHQTGNDVSL